MDDMMPAITESLERIFGTEYAHSYLRAKELDRRLLKERIDFGNTLLDVGGGLGIDDWLFAHYGAECVIVDLKRDDLRRGKATAKKLKLQKNIDYFLADARNLPFRSGSFDIATSFTAIEHLSNKHEFKIWINEMARVLKNGGKFALTTMNKSWVLYPVAKILISLKLNAKEHFFDSEEIINHLNGSAIQTQILDYSMIYHRGYLQLPSFIPLSNRFTEHLEKLSYTLETFAGLKVVCGRIGFLGIKLEG